MKKALILIAAAVLLSACAECGSSTPESSDETVQKTVTAPTVTESKPAQSSTAREPEPEPETVRVQALSYDDKQLTFVLDGETLTLPLFRRAFTETEMKGMRMLSDIILENRFGETLYADIKISRDGKMIDMFDVITPNVVYYSNASMDPKPTKSREPEELETVMKRVSGSVYEFSNSFGTVTADMNDLENYRKCRIPASAENACFNGYIFSDGNFILRNFGYNGHTDENGVRVYEEHRCEDYCCFFGTVQSVTDDRACVLLTDGKTLCDVPTYYNDGEVAEGAEVMIMLDAEPSLFGSGERFEDDYAVFHTRPETYNTSGKEFESLAYAKYSDQTVDTLIYVDKCKQPVF